MGFPIRGVQGLRSIGPFVGPQFIEIVKERNRLARLLGYEDFYDYKVGNTGGGKWTLNADGASVGCGDRDGAARRREGDLAEADLLTTHWGPGPERSTWV